VRLHHGDGHAAATLGYEAFDLKVAARWLRSLGFAAVEVTELGGEPRLTQRF